MNGFDNVQREEILNLHFPRIDLTPWVPLHISVITFFKVVTVVARGSNRSQSIFPEIQLCECYRHPTYMNEYSLCAT